MGIAIMELVMDEVRFEFHSGTTVWMMKRLHV
jgi:anti-sigma regulatory factor (Ser/Thr protein kinase)